MTKKLQKALDTYYQKLKVFRAFSTAQSLLSWDRETYMPKGAAGDRGETMSVLAGFSHELFTEKEFVKVVDELYEGREELQAIDKRSVTLLKKELDKSVKLSKEFVEETNLILNAAHTAWIEAKQQDAFALFEPHLEKVVANRQQYAEILHPEKDPYDLQLDDYEEGLTAEKLEPLFKKLRSGLKELLPRVVAKQKEVANPLNNIVLDHNDLEHFMRKMVTTIGFNLDRGGFGRVEHPFEISISQNDVRLNTKFTENENSFTVMGMVHELGHGLYEQNVDPKYTPAGIDHGVSLGIHESQSRLLENIIGRSRAFWIYFLPKLKEYFPQLKDVTVDQMFHALNCVQPSLIRTEADEVTYNLHIVLRFELEKRLLRKDIQVKDLPELWQAQMEELLGVVPRNDKDGVLQDVHWSWGNFGYFPTYTLGNMNAAQFFMAFEKEHPQWEAEVETGNFTSYFTWFKEHVWQHGSFYTPEEVLRNATGQELQAEHLLKYLEKKYVESA